MMIMCMADMYVLYIGIMTLSAGQMAIGIEDAAKCF